MSGLSDAWFYRLKAAQRDLIKLAGGIERAADLTSISKSQVGRWNNAGDAEIMTLSAVLVLEAECGRPIVTSVMAELNGRRLADPQAERQAAACIFTAHADTARHAGELMSAAALAIADGQVTPAEADQLDRAAGVLDRSVSEFRKAVASIRGNGLKIVGGQG